MKKIALLIACCLKLSAHAQQYWQQEVSYTIDVALNDTEHTLDGFVKIQYSNHSPDTLGFIWFHVWPNAYKNDKTAFSDQMLENGRTDFYFSDKEQHGYINRLDFRIDGRVVRTEDHPQYIDIIKIILPRPLEPGQSVQISTPFHEKLPLNFSRGGHLGQSYQITQWYPKPAVYDQKGWHPMPYLDQGEFYSEYGNYDVRITVPANYVVAATGELQDEDEKKWLLERTRNTEQKKPAVVSPPMQKRDQKKTGVKKPAPHKSYPVSHKQHPAPLIPSAPATKTLQYKQSNIHDFAWFADKRFIVYHDTISLASGRTIDAFSFSLPESKDWSNSMQWIKSAILFRSALIGEYPYAVVSIVETGSAIPGGMEYPTIAAISSKSADPELTVEHELGHNWFYGALGSNERRYPWMDEGINSYYDQRYQRWKYRDKQPAGSGWFSRKMPEDRNRFFLSILIKEKTDQPVSTSSEDFSETNYNLVAYTKTAMWMKQLEDTLGTDRFDSCMREYFRRWQFKHPYPEDFRQTIEKTSGKNMDAAFALLDKKGPLQPEKPKKIKPAFLFSARNTDQVEYINFGPAIGYNNYDKFMIGALIHNFNLPPSRFQFLLAPLYATGSKQLNGIGNLSYSWYPDNRFQKITAGINGERFSTLSGTDSNGRKVFGGFYKIAPYLRFSFRNKNARSTIEKWIEWRTFIIGEKAFDYSLKSTDTLYYPSPQPYSGRYLNQLGFNIENYRVLYPYSAQLQVQQASAFYRVNLTGNYFFNYSKGGGMSVRFFAAKFGYIGEKTSSKEFATVAYQPKLTAVRGNEDYTYSNYFIGRNESTGFPSQQMMMRDGGLKLRTDLFQGLQGRSDNWIAAMNFNTSLPNKLFPVKLPLKIFFDIGTYSDAWTNDPPTSKFLYVAGLQVSLFKNILNIYAPLFYSSDFRNNFKTVPDENTFWKKISFSIDIQQISPKRIFGNMPLQ